MSGHALRLKAGYSPIPFISSCASLRVALERAGVKPLDDAWVKKAMEAAVYGLPPWTSSWRLQLVQKIGRKPDEWKVFSYDEYALHARVVERRNWNPEYGMPMPDEIVQRVKRIDMIVPGLKEIEVHALLRDDPYVKVVRGEESAWIGAWYGRGKRQRVFPET
ncbi:MAG: hypothetical protein WAZ27_03530 [Minisyncoccia bacterium]